MIIYIAGLQNVPDDLIEAAEIDGAAKWDILLEDQSSDGNVFHHDLRLPDTYQFI